MMINAENSKIPAIMDSEINETLKELISAIHPNIGNTAIMMMLNNILSIEIIVAR